MKKKILLVVFVLLAWGVFAQTTENLEEAFKNKDISSVQFILENTEADDVQKTEEKIINEVKAAVEADDLDYASELANVVLMFDFDNKEAQKLYTSIEKAKKNKAEQLARQQEEEKQKREAEEKKQKEEEEKRRMEEYYVQKEKEEQEVAKAKDDYIESVSSVGWKNFPIEAAISPVALDFSGSPFANAYNNSEDFIFRYGLGLVLEAGFNHPYVKINTITNYQFYFSSDGNKSDFNTRLTVGLPSFSNIFRISLGYRAVDIISNNDIALYTNVKTPTAGIGIEDLRFNSLFSISCFADMDLITLDSKSTIDFSGGFDFVFKYELPFSVKGIKLYVDSDTKFNGIRVSNETEWNVDTILNFGVKFND